MFYKNYLIFIFSVILIIAFIILIYSQTSDEEQIFQIQLCEKQIEKIKYGNFPNKFRVGSKWELFFTKLH